MNTTERIKMNTTERLNLFCGLGALVNVHFLVISEIWHNLPLVKVNDDTFGVIIGKSKLLFRASQIAEIRRDSHLRTKTTIVLK